MSEAVATAPEQSASTPALYPLDQSQQAVELLIKLSDEKTLKIEHVLRRPTLAELIERDAQSVTEMEEIAPNEDAFHADTELANARLWDKVAQAVTGYKVGGRNKSESIAVTPEIAAKIPAGHKSVAISGLYASRCTVEKDDDEGFDLDGDSYVIRQDIGAGDEPQYVIRHTLKQPTEADRREYDKMAGKASQVTGSRRRKVRFRANLKAEVAMYDKLFVSIEGVKVGESGEYNSSVQASYSDSPQSKATSESAKPLVDPIFKRQVVQTLLSSLSASLSD